MNVDYFRGKVKAGKLGIQPSFRPQDGSLTVCQPQFHIGHAKALTVSRMICDYLDIPLWVRFKMGLGDFDTRWIDNENADKTRRYVKYALRTIRDCWCQMCDCANWLGIRVDRTYAAAEPEDVPAWFNKHLQDVLHDLQPRKFWDGDAPAQWYDDAVLHYPLLLLRGADFAPPIWNAGAERYIGLENTIFESLGKEKFQVEMPLILRGQWKMSTSTLNAETWEILRTLDREDEAHAKRLAYAWLTEGVNLHDLPGESKQWDYSEFARWGVPQEPCSPS